MSGPNPNPNPYGRTAVKANFRGDFFMAAQRPKRILGDTFMADVSIYAHHCICMITVCYFSN